MTTAIRDATRAFLKEALEKLGDRQSFTDSESLFSSGRLDSFTMMNLVLHLEAQYALDFSAFEFEVELVDSVEAIERLLESNMPS